MNHKLIWRNWNLIKVLTIFSYDIWFIMRDNMFLFPLLIRLIWPYCDDKQIFYKKDKKSRECILMSLILLTLKHTFWTFLKILWINQTQNATKLGFITMKICLDNNNIKSHFDTTHEWWSHEAGKDNSFTPFVSGYCSRKQKMVL